MPPRTNSEKLLDLCEGMNENELRSFAALITSKADNMHRKATNEAWQKVLQAWQEYRHLAPNESRYVSIDTEEGFDIDVDLFELMDTYLN